MVQSTRKIERGTILRQQVQGEEVFPDEAHNWECVKVVQ